MPKIPVKGITPGRLVAARKAVQRDKDSWALFPENVRHETAEERIAAIDAGLEAADIEGREERAAEWRELRATIRALPAEMRQKVLQFWNRKAYPGSPVYLRAVLREAANGGCDLDKQNAQLERAKLMGRIMDECRNDPEIVAQIPPDLSNKDESFLRLRLARQRAEKIAPHLFPATPTA